MPDAFAGLLRLLRTRRRWSQERLALAAGVSSRHLSCLETGKSRPSREMVLQLAQVLELELRDRNALLVSAGFAAAFPTTALDSIALALVNRAVDLLLAKQGPYGAVVVDRCWNVLRVNAGARRLLEFLLAGSVLPPRVATNLMHASLHPGGLRPYLVNWEEVAALCLERVERAAHNYPEDAERRALLDELRAYPDVARMAPGSPSSGAPMAILHFRRGEHELRLFTLLTTIGTPFDVTAQELTIESFFPADAASERWFVAASAHEDG